MKKRLVSVLLALAMCMGLAVPAFAEDVNSSATAASELSVSANEIDMSMPYHYTGVVNTTVSDDGIVTVSWN